MSELTLTLLRLGYLTLLWLLVLTIVAVLRRDLYGTRVTRRVTRGGTAGAAAAGAPRSAPARASRNADDGQRDSPRTLVVIEGSLQGTTLALGTAPILIGRAPECTLVLEDDYASNRHAKFAFHQGTWLIEDLGSTNGTYLGRTRVHEPLPVEPGVPVRVGRTVLELRR
ncbi:MAG: FHA domain-containing protein [Kineosporiaceae bacterium]|jgi:pSer/pThr/pTyr-binding forkhead associated (FHA) protein